MTLLRTLDRALYRMEFSLLVLFLSSMIILSFTQVFLRNAFGTGLVWADTIIRHLVIWVGFVGAALAATEERHIGIDALTKFLPTRIKHTAHVVTSLFAVIACFYLGDAAWTYLKDEQTSGGGLVLGIQTWQALLIIPIGYFLIAFHFLVKVVVHMRGVLGRDEEKPA